MPIYTPTRTDADGLVRVLVKWTDPVAFWICLMSAMCSSRLKCDLETSGGLWPCDIWKVVTLSHLEGFDCVTSGELWPCDIWRVVTAWHLEGCVCVTWGEACVCLIIYARSQLNTASSTYPSSDTLNEIHIQIYQCVCVCVCLCICMYVCLYVCLCLVAAHGRTK